jgi:hypothetical protein
MSLLDEGMLGFFKHRKSAPKTRSV